MNNVPAHLKIKLVKQNAETLKKSEKKRHRRPVKKKPLGEVDFSALV